MELSAANTHGTLISADLQLSSVLCYAELTEIDGEPTATVVLEVMTGAVLWRSQQSIPTMPLWHPDGSALLYFAREIADLLAPLNALQSRQACTSLWMHCCGCGSTGPHADLTRFSTHVQCCSSGVSRHVRLAMQLHILQRTIVPNFAVQEELHTILP